jgi:SPW repeat
MTMGKPASWQDWANLVLGVWLFVSPWSAHFSQSSWAAWNAYVAGAGVMLAASLAIHAIRPRHEWGNLLIGLWLVISPWVLDFDALAKASVTTAAIGAALTALAAWTMARDGRPGGRWRDHRGHTI